MVDRGIEHEETALELSPLSKRGENDWHDIYDASVMKQGEIARRIKVCFHQRAVILRYLYSHVDNRILKFA
jgi:hypothetical protein